MKVDVDQIWATPSNLHLRVCVWADDRAWRHKYYVAVPLEDIEDAVVATLLEAFTQESDEPDHHQTALF